MLFKARCFRTSSHFVSYHSQSSCPLVVLLRAIVVLFVLLVSSDVEVDEDEDVSNDNE